MIRKALHGDADYILTLFTRDFGKIRGFAKNAKRSKKRFGGRLEPFVQFRVRFRDKLRDMRFVEDAETVRVFHNLMENIELFLWGSFIIETVESLLPEESPAEELFELLVQTLGELDSGKTLGELFLQHLYLKVNNWRKSSKRPTLETQPPSWFTIP